LLCSSYLNSVRRTIRHACNIICLQLSFWNHFEPWSSREQMCSCFLNPFCWLSASCFSSLIDIILNRPGFETFQVPSWKDLFVSKFILFCNLRVCHHGHRHLHFDLFFASSI
jgi:hypothetical protein